MDGSHSDGASASGKDRGVGTAESGPKHAAINARVIDDGSTNTDERLDAAWAQAEREVDAKRTSPPHSPPIEAVGENSYANEDGHTARDMGQPSEQISPLMAHPSDATLQTSNRALLLTSNGDTDRTRSAESFRTIGLERKDTEMIPAKQTIIQRYRTFLQKHEPSLDLVEHFLERFVFYGYLFKHDHRGISTEVYYAAWNVIRWMNDVVLVGWGEGMGTTVGRREEWLSPTSSASKAAMPDSILSGLNSAVPVLRAILTATTCIYPALEAWSRRSTSANPSYGEPLIPYDGSPQTQEECQFATTSDPSPQRRRSEWEARQCRASQVSYRLERVRFLSRLALLSISWWAQYQKRCLRVEGDDKNQQSHEIEKDGMGMMLPSLLRRGGELDPYEQLVPLKDAEDEAKVVQYVGKRTGRRSIARGSSASTPFPRAASAAASSSSFSSGSTFVKWLTGLASSKNRVLYAYALGELLHILRPLYWISAESKERRRRASSPTISRSPFSFGIWKAWCISLLMDLISDKLLQIGHGGDSSSSNNANAQRRGSFLSRGGGRHHPPSTHSTPSAEQAKLEELDWRRSRRGMYLLRSPMYNAVTRPLATFIARLVSMIPTFGLGQWAAEYALDMMSYWNDNHFMLES